jgi:hypothetical protein
MALRQPIEIANTGLVAGYWRLTHLQLDHDAGTLEFRLHGYSDRAARQAGKAPLPVLAWRTGAAELGLASLHAVDSADLYAAARRLPATDGVVHFADAEDC